MYIFCEVSAEVYQYKSGVNHGFSCNFITFLLIFVTGACRFMKRDFGRIDQIWNLKIKLYPQGNPSFA